MVAQTQQKKPAVPAKDNKTKGLANSVQQDSVVTMTFYEGYKGEAKINCLKRITLMKNIAKNQIKNVCKGYSETCKKSESLVRHSYASQIGMFRSLQAFISQKIESEQKLDNWLTLGKFHITEDQSIKNYILSKPVPLFDASQIKWEL